MRWIEIIRLRTNGTPALDELIEGLGRSLEHEPAELAIYRHAAVATDLSVHIVSETEEGAQPERTLGQRLAATLEQHGLVNRSLWVEAFPVS